MTTDISNAIVPSRLDELVIAYIAQNLSQTICRGSNEDDLKLNEKISLPQAIADPILQYLVDSLYLDPLQKEPASKKLVKYVRIFTDVGKCKLRRITINRAPVSDDLLQVLCNLCESHSLLEIDLSHSTDMNGDDKDETPPYNHATLLPGFIIRFCGKTLQKLTLNHSFLAYSINQIMAFSGKKAKALKQDVYLTSEATLDHITTCLSSGNAPVLTSLDISEAFTAWFMTIDPMNPPPLKALNFGGYNDIRLNSTVTKILKHLIYGEEDYEPKPGRPRATVAHSMSEIKLAKYPFFDKIGSARPMLDKFLKASDLKIHLDEESKYENDYSLEPESNFVLRQMNLLSLKNTLQQLGLYNTWLTKNDFEEVVFKLKGLRHLDVAWPSKQLTNSRRFRPEGITVWQILENLPQLNFLDVSGTYYGENLWEEAEVVEGEKILKMNHKREPLQFLGLWGTSSCRLKGIEKLGIRISGDSTEEQLLMCIEMYFDRAEIISDVLSKLSTIQQESTRNRPNLTLKLVLKCMYQYPTNSNLLYSCAANIFFLVQLHMSTFTVYQKRDIIKATTMLLEKNSSNEMLVRNCMVIFFNFELPRDILFDFDHIAKLVLDIFDKQRDVREVNIIAGNMCNALVCSMEIDVKTQIRKLEYTDIMINVIKGRLRSNNGDDVLDTAWSALWNVTDETPVNSEDFINMGGLSLFRQCYENFPGHHDLHRNMMGLIGNIAEVNHLRPHLAEKEILNLVIHLVSSTDSGIEVAYNACGVLANLLIDESNILEDAPLENIRSEMRAAVLSWNVDVARNINYRTFEPLFHVLRCAREPIGHLWVMWAIHNLCIREEKYVHQVITDGGVELIKSIRDSTEDDKTREFSGEIIKKTVTEGGLSESLLLSSGTTN